MGKDRAVRAGQLGIPPFLHEPSQGFGGAWELSNMCSFVKRNVTPLASVGLGVYEHVCVR